MLARRSAGLAAVVVMAVAARAAAVLLLQSHTVPRSTYEHGEIAANLLAGRGFAVQFLGADGPTSQQAPAYPLLVAAAYALGGVGTPRALLGLELFQAILGGLTAASAVWLCREAAPGRPRAALLAGLVAAIHPTLVYSATHVQVATLATLLLTATLAAAYRAGRTGQGRHAAGAGGLLGLLLLTDPILGLVLPGAAAAIAIGAGRRRGLRLAGVMAVVAAIVVAPWIARNYRVHGELVLVKSTFGYAFWQGNCALSQGTDKVVRPSVETALARPGDGGLKGWNQALWAARHEAGYLDDVALTAADYRTLGAIGEPARSRLLFRRALADLRAEPGRYPTLCLRRLRYFFLFDETNPKTRSPLYRAAQLGLGAWAVAGWLAIGPTLRRRLAPTAWTVGLIALFHALTIVSARFHIPIEPILGVWGAVGLSRWSGRATPGPHFAMAAQPRRAIASNDSGS